MESMYNLTVGTAPNSTHTTLGDSRPGQYTADCS
jgi:hypothetical protein